MDEIKIYNDVYSRQSEAWRKRRSSFYHNLSSFIVPSDEVFDIGCGNGILASISTWKSYTGIDFSNVAIEQAINRCSRAKFICDDVIKILNEDQIHYNTVVMTEFLEHVEDDLFILSKIKNDVKIIISVPHNEETINGKPVGYPIHKRAYTLETFINRYNIIKFKTTYVFDHWIIGVGVK